MGGANRNTPILARSVGRSARAPAFDLSPRLNALRHGQPDQNESPAAAPLDLQEVLAALRETWRSDRKGRRETQLHQIESWFRLAGHLQTHKDDLVLFARQPEFAQFKGARPNIDKPDDVLRPIIRFVFGFGEKAKRRVSRYANALERAFKEGKSADEIAKYVVVNGGINKMATANVKNRRSSRRPGPAQMTLKADVGELAQRVLDAEPGQHLKLGVEVLSRAGNTAVVEITSVKPRKSPKGTV
ncbi:MAG: hypothetical protein JWQ89_2275 [Devosia sp.]|uniref:hypothetical protein n=1 Tax=Devosia sp. TaxID=1871048 RepID=UPI00260621C9|nr:hypothetical protein [Devosia sp.]MDB5540548.1 hypothetical protein [Devosia sp.]